MHGTRLLPGAATPAAAQVSAPPNVRSTPGFIAWLDGK